MLKNRALLSLLVISYLSFLVSGCKNFLASSDSDFSTDEKFASLEIVPSEIVPAQSALKSPVRALDLSENGVCYAVVSISGTGIGGLCQSDYVQVSGGKGSSVVVKNIPVGKNRIVTVQGYDKDKNAVNGAVIRNITDISYGSNSCSVTQSTTALGNVFNSLLAKNHNLNSLEKTDIEKIQAAIDSSKSWALIDTAKIASDYISGSLSEKTSYYVSTGTVNIVNGTSDSSYLIKILDPSSSVTNVGSGTQISDSAPGVWSVQLLDSSKNILAGASDLKVISGKTSTVTVEKSGSADLSGKTIVFVKASSAPSIWAWEDGGVALSKELGETWEGSGSKMSAATNDYMANPDGWFMRDFSSVATGKTIKFKLNWSDNEITGKAGTFWYDGSSSSSENPSPVSASGDVYLKIENPFDSSDGITVHAKYKYIYIWNSGVTSLDNTCEEMKSEGDGWYYYEIPAASASIIFKDVSGTGIDDWTGETDNLSRSEKGEWWYSGGKWYDGNPEDSVAPVLTSFSSDKTGTVSGTVILTATATDDKNLKSVTFSLADGTELGVGNVTGTSGTATYSWDTTKIQNGSYTVKAVAKDAAGNSSSEKTLTLTTNNKNLPPVAVISGSSTAKIGSSKTYNASSSYDQNGGTIASYDWTVTGATIDGTSTSESVTVIMPSSVTTVTISLKVTDNDGASSETVSKTVTVKEGTSENWDFRDETIYFLMTTRFYDGDSSNNEYCWDEGGEYLKFGDDVKDCAWRGDFKGLAEKLDYIKALGFSAIWITPVVQNASGIDYHGYHAYNFKKVDPRYESNNFTYQDLIDACHAKGIKVIQDIVLNHTGNFGEENLFHMFDKETTPYVNKDVATTTSIPRSPFMKVAEDGKTILGGNAYEKLMAGLKQAGGSDYDSAIGEIQYGARINAMKEDTIDTELIYHHTKMIDWNSENCQLGQMAGDCVDLNTENPAVFNYLIDAYNQYIDMGVDAFRIDTVKHISRYTFNKEFIPAFKERGGDDFYIFGETCARYRGRWNEGVPALSPSFYTWKETVNLPWNSTGGAEESKTNSSSASTHFETYKSSFTHPAWADGIANHLLNGNSYHKPDYSMRSGLDQIDFPMHWAFNSAGDAFSTAVNTNDPDFNDATWNVTYVDSHDYAPDNAPENKRYTGNWPDKLNLLFTFRGIPCIYYGSEIEFKKGMGIDPATERTSLENSGRAYFGDHLEGSVTATDYGEYTASGEVANTLNHDLAQHIIRLNKIRRAVPALRKGQYSTQNCSGSIAFKRRYTDSEVDSFALVAINGSATFSGLPAGNYVEVITGNSVSVSEGGSISTDSIGEGNMRVYVNTSLNGCEVSGKIGNDGAYLK